MMWSKYVIEAQVYIIENNVLYKRKKTTLLVTNGCMSVGKVIKHIKILFFFITDKISQVKMTVQHRGTDLMWADGNANPLQGM